MNKIFIIAIFLVFIIYTGVSFFVNIPNLLNSIFFGLISLAAIYFSVFHFEIGTEIKRKFNENKTKLDVKNAMKNR